MKLYLCLLYVSAYFISASIYAAEPDLNTSLNGKWITETNGKVMFDPQTSGLKHWRGKLLSISDGSAHKTQQKQLHIIDPQSAILTPESLVMTMSDKVKNSCFVDYLTNKPDYEALAVDPNNDKVFIIVTEDARNSAPLNNECQTRFQQTGSTDYPTLLVRLELQDNYTVQITHVRPLQFDKSFNVGDYANDGIEGLAFGKDNVLYLGLEKDMTKHARIFSVNITNDFWQTDDFAKVDDPQLLLPQFESGNHPINGMDYLAVDDHPGFLIAAARNDNKLWIIDLAKGLPTKKIDLTFYSPTDDKSCDVWDKMHNSSLEGVGIVGNTVWLVNDPWKRNYSKNIICPSNKPKFEQMAPLLFSIEINKDWLQ